VPSVCPFLVSCYRPYNDQSCHFFPHADDTFLHTAVTGTLYIHTSVCVPAVCYGEALTIWRRAHRQLQFFLIFTLSVFPFYISVRFDAFHLSVEVSKFERNSAVTPACRPPHISRHRMLSCEFGEFSTALWQRVKWIRLRTARIALSVRLYTAELCSDTSKCTATKRPDRPQ